MYAEEYELQQLAEDSGMRSPEEKRFYAAVDERARMLGLGGGNDGSIVSSRPGPPPRQQRDAIAVVGGGGGGGSLSALGQLSPGRRQQPKDPGALAAFLVQQGLGHHLDSIVREHGCRFIEDLLDEKTDLLEVGQRMKRVELQRCDGVVLSFISPSLWLIFGETRQVYNCDPGA